ncbi:hypothetical protein [Streptomyces rishiriensis]|uniref:hypothetical protein n=1 Tax=Streptomyces rishiriensis TaxID=68264 RepID=UPI000D592ADE|nr:hypothetical protein [Streptomyces rishiriensis]
MTDQHTPLTTQQLDEIEARAARLYERTATIDPNAHPDFGQLTDTDVPALVADLRRSRAELAAGRALAADATEYRIHVPEDGGTTLLVRRQASAHGAGWAVSTMAPGGGRAWTTEGWQESISALSVDRLFCWPDPAVAAAEARQALAAASAVSGAADSRQA